MNNLIINELNTLLANADSKWITRKRKIDTKLLFEFMSQSIVQDKGIKHLLSYNGLFNNSCELSDAAICKARTRCNYSIFDSIKNKLVDKFTIKNNIYAVDGSKIRLPPTFANEGYTTRSPTSKPILGMISTVYDVTNKIPINTLLCKHHNERAAICDQLKYLPKNSTLIFDRGYYSKNMVIELNKYNVKYLFRLKKDANKQINIFFHNKRKKSERILIEGYRMRIFKYKIDNKIYLCGTNINDSINNLKNLYKKRWTVEEGFKTMKSNLHLKTIHSKTNDLLKQEIAIRELLFVVSRLIQLNIKSKGLYYKTSFKLVLDFIVNYFSSLIYIFQFIQKKLFNCQFINFPDRKRN